jgi:hypothetical protein
MAATIAASRTDVANCLCPRSPKDTPEVPDFDGAFGSIALLLHRNNLPHERSFANEAERKTVPLIYVMLHESCAPARKILFYWNCLAFALVDDYGVAEADFRVAEAVLRFNDRMGADHWRGRSWRDILPMEIQITASHHLL